MEQEIISALIQAQAAFHQYDQDGEFKGHSKTLAQKKVTEALEKIRTTPSLTIETSPFKVKADGNEQILNVFKFLACQASATEYFTYTEEFMSSLFNSSLEKKYAELLEQQIVPSRAGAPVEWTIEQFKRDSYIALGNYPKKKAIKRELDKQKKQEQVKFATQFEAYKTRIDGLMSHMMTMGEKFETADQKMVDGIMAFMEKGIIDKTK